LLNSKFVAIFMLHFLTSAVLYFYSTKYQVGEIDTMPHQCLI